MWTIGGNVYTVVTLILQEFSDLKNQALAVGILP